MSSNVVTIQKVGFERNTSLEPQSLGELIKYAEYIYNASMVPKTFTPADIVVAVQLGTSIGLSVAQSLHNIAIINGKPSIYGDMMLALCRASPLCEYVKEEIQGDEKEEWIAICTVKRKGNPEVISKFSWQDAVDAKLIEKAMKPNSKGWVNESAPWLTYPKRMLQMRARGFALRDAFPDLLNGLISQEEAQDYPTQTIEPPPVQLQSRPVNKPEDIPEMPVIEPKKSKLEIGYERLSTALSKVSSLDDLQHITKNKHTIGLRAELSENEPELAGVINDLIEQALASFEVQGELANAV